MTRRRVEPVDIRFGQNVYWGSRLIVAFLVMVLIAQFVIFVKHHWLFLLFLVAILLIATALLRWFIVVHRPLTGEGDTEEFELPRDEPKKPQAAYSNRR